MARRQLLSPADMKARLESLRRHVYQLEVDVAMGLFANKPEDYESLVTPMQDEIRSLEAALLAQQ